MWEGRLCCLSTASPTGHHVLSPLVAASRTRLTRVAGQPAPPPPPFLPVRVSAGDRQRRGRAPAERVGRSTSIPKSCGRLSYRGDAVRGEVGRRSRGPPRVPRRLR